jgi:replicative DNA helicase
MGPQSRMELLPVDDLEVRAAPLSKAFSQALDQVQLAGELEAIDGMLTGFKDLDVLLGGLRAPELMTICGRSSMETSALVMGMTTQVAAVREQSVLHISTDTSRTEFGLRMLASATPIPMSQLMAGRIQTSDWGRIGATVTRITRTPIFIYNNPFLTTDDIRSQLEFIGSENYMSLLVVDGLERIIHDQGDSLGIQGLSRSLFQLKRLALEYRVAIVASLAYDEEAPGDGSPGRFGISGFESVERFSDVVALLGTSAVERPPQSTRAREVEMSIVKNRNGALGRLTLDFTPSECRMVSKLKVDS